MTKNEVVETIRTWIQTIDDEYDIEEQGRVYGLMEALELVKQIDDLDKIRAEFISLYPKNYLGEPQLGGSGCVFSLNKVLKIIDKYKAESEDKR